MEDDLSHLSDREHVRQRPSMYIGDTGSRGLHHLAFEIIEHSIVASDGSAESISILLSADGALSVEHDGHGVPAMRHDRWSKELGRDISTLEASMTILKFDSGARLRIDGGLHGVGPIVVNFLSEWCQVDSCDDGKRFRQSYRGGVPTGPVQQLEDSVHGGLRITFRPDRKIFSVTDFNYEVIRARVVELAFLCAGARFTLSDERTNRNDVYCWPGGTVDYVRHLNWKREPVHSDIVHLRRQSDGIEYDIALQYCAGCQEDVHSFANMVRCNGYRLDVAAGGTHVSGFRRALAESLERYGRERGPLVDDLPSGHDFFYGLSAVVAVQLPDATWEGSTRSILGNQSVHDVIERDLKSYLNRYFVENPKSAEAIMQKLLHSAQLRNETPPIDYQLFTEQERMLTMPDEDPNSWGSTAWFPASYRVRMIRRNGGVIQTPTDRWHLFPVRDESTPENLKRTLCDVINQTKLAYERRGFPSRGLAIGENGKGQWLVFIRRTDRICGENYPNPYADELYRWDDASGELERIADDFDELCWQPTEDEGPYTTAQ